MTLSSTHTVGSDGETARECQTLGLRIDNGCWICGRATILPDVRIGADAIVAAGAVVSADCDPGGIYAGVPAGEFDE
jgi:maltose O-acetyltransferase